MNERTKVARSIPRRTALKGLGALAVSAPAVAAIGCSTDADEMMSPLGAGGTGAAATPKVPDAPGAAPPAAGTSSTPVGAAGMSSGGAGSTSRGTTMAGAGETPAAGTGAPAGGGASGMRAGSSGASAGAGGQGASAGAAAGSGGSASGFIPVTFETVASCTLTPTDRAGEGPFFIHDDEVMNDPVLERVDLRDGKPGIEFQLNLRVLDSEGMCMRPISGVEVYVWHTDALGFYSGFANQNPDQTYTGGLERTVENMDRFCRGTQVTDAEGIVRFKTVYPGWYNGRAIHIHFVALRPGSAPETTSYRSMQSMVFTTQMYFAEQFSRMIHESNAPYNTRLTGGYMTYVKPQNTVVMPTTRLEGNIVVGALNIVTAAGGSRR